jgi:hypothetical protein
MVLAGSSWACPSSGSGESCGERTRSRTQKAIRFYASWRARAYANRRNSSSEESARDVLNGTARISRPADTKFVPNNTKPQSLSDLKPGDVLVSHSTAIREHEISVIPNAPHATSPTHGAAVGDGRSEADAKGVDAWLTEDQTHVVKIASHRAPDK